VDGGRGSDEDLGMPLQPPGIIDTRHLFRPVSRDLVSLLRALPAGAWERPTLAGSWVVRDVAAHLLDTTLRRLSFHRDGLPPPAPGREIASERDFAAFINELNAAWVAAAARLSPRVLTDLFERASAEAADWFESLPLDAPALFPVSWAGEEASAGWFDVGREFTELWHHREQIRLAVGDDTPDDPRHLAAVLDVAMRGLPHALRWESAEAGAAVVIEVTGASGGTWTVSNDEAGWTLQRGEGPSPAARLRLADQVAWKLLFNALSEADANAAVHIEGSDELGRALLRARSVIV
jgi:uncharacterized protein (TIGR03083 family)